MSTNIKFYIKESLKYFLRSKIFIRKELKEVERLYGLSEDELYAYKEEQFLKLFKHAMTKSPFYKEFYGKAGITIDDIQSLKDIEKLPVLTKEIVRQNNKKIPTVATWRLFKARTSGTTGTPLMIYQDYQAVKKFQAYLRYFRLRCSFEYGEPIVSLRGYFDKVKLKHNIHISNTLYLSSYNINQENILKYFNYISKFKPKAIEGHPSSLYNLCLLLKQNNLNVNIPLVFTSSESLYTFQRDFIEDVFRAKICDLYGCTELAILLTQTAENNYYKEEPGFSINEYYETKIITTSLINNSFPLIRYQIDDILSTKKLEQQTIIDEIHGRIEDQIVCKDGTKIGRTDDLFTRVKNVLLAQIIQNEVGAIDINIVPDEKFSEIDKRTIYNDIHKKSGENNLDIKINTVTSSEIIYTKRNKFKFVLSNI